MTRIHLEWFRYKFDLQECWKMVLLTRHISRCASVRCSIAEVDHQPLQSPAYFSPRSLVLRAPRPSPPNCLTWPNISTRSDIYYLGEDKLSVTQMIIGWVCFVFSLGIIWVANIWEVKYFWRHVNHKILHNEVCWIRRKINALIGNCLGGLFCHDSEVRLCFNVFHIFSNWKIDVFTDYR